MNDLEFTAESFDSSVVGNKLVVWLKTMAMDILTDLETSVSFQNLLYAASEASNLDGYIQIKDSLWASHTDITSLSQMISDDDEPYAAGGRVYGYHHEVMMARFRSTLGYCLLALRSFSKPMVAGLQGPVSAEYLGLTLLFDSRIATSDTTISFDNVRSGIPSSPSITLLMPGYIGTGKTLALANQGAVITAQEALDLGLVSSIIEQGSDLKQACIDSVGKFSENHLDIVGCNRQHILPPGEKISAALDVYYKAVSKMIIRRRAARKQLHNHRSAEA
jgi:enoyl-CoA hydratase/carnithine racemase